jgi:putative ABC transport system substrate-binding protein
MAPFIAPAAEERVYRLAELEPTATALELTHNLTLPELAKLGFIEGRNLVLDTRVGDPVTMAGFARELVRAHPDAIIAGDNDAISAAHEVTSTVPVVILGGDPVENGWAESLAHPGGNITGVAVLARELDGKRLDLLHQAVPTARRVTALLAPRSTPGRQPSEHEISAVAAHIGIEILLFEAAGSAEYPAAFAAMREAGAQGLLVMAYPIFYRDAEPLARLALQAGLPAVCEWAEMAQSGCMIGYGPSRPELRRRMAHYVARIFQGAAPADLPIEQPTHYEFAVNLQIAKALGLTIPPSILARADEVIE